MDNNSVFNLLTWSSAVLVASLPGIIQLVASRLDERRKRIEHFDELKLAALTEYINDISSCSEFEPCNHSRACMKIYLYVDPSQWELVDQINDCARTKGRDDEARRLLAELLKRLDVPKEQQIQFKAAVNRRRGRWLH